MPRTDREAQGTRYWLTEAGWEAATKAQEQFYYRPTAWSRATDRSRPGLDVAFVGGTTEWKLGLAARQLVAEAKRRGKWVHMGRVNSERRWRYAEAIGVDSCDGTYLTFGPDVNLPRLLAWTRNNEQPSLFGGVA